MKRLCIATTWLFCLFLSGSLLAQEAPGTTKTIARYTSGGGFYSTGSIIYDTRCNAGGGLVADAKGNLYVGPGSIYLPDGSRTG